LGKHRRNEALNAEFDPSDSASRRTPLLFGQWFSLSGMRDFHSLESRLCRAHKKKLHGFYKSMQLLLHKSRHDNYGLTPLVEEVEDAAAARALRKFCAAC
jgi:hypothetical protein